MYNGLPIKHHFSSLLCAILAATASAPAGEWGDLTPPDQVPVQLPQGYDGSTPHPVILLLHGYSPVGGEWTDDAVLGFADPSYERGHILVRPTGSSDGICYYWNATEACCDFEGANPDHVGYLLAILDHLQATYAIDPRHIHLVGYSNGGFMAHRMGCEHPERFASITSISGAGPMSMDDCVATDSLHVLELHGTADATILYGGGALYGVPYPGVSQTLNNWAQHMGCSDEPQVDDEWFNMDGYTWGDETHATHYTPQCAMPGTIESWDAIWAQHQFLFFEESFDRFFDWFASHPSPPACSGDLTGDGAVDVLDLLDLLALYGTPGGDLDGDGLTGVTDLLIVLGAWGPCT